MHNAVLLSSNNEIRQPCSFVLAQQLLRQGLAKIVQYYPLTVKFKGNSQDDAPAMVQNGDTPPRMDSKKSSLIREYL
ncbi:hypothetical protein [Candidatus Berkiella aquae]|uniref:Uncharacterized protein n=1 Tax=Candidatus Berkiella aquae TaxID=295108 RepID=A0A0Q9YP26_9GAMM|nr:hypothetical protein [Candidatus Berkiella aquae]MCS5711029.1 hypothetical protein [Candidatus Berkiella aquae]